MESLYNVDVNQSEYGSKEFSNRSTQKEPFISEFGKSRDSLSITNQIPNLDHFDGGSNANFMSAFGNFCKSLLGISILDIPYMGFQVGYVYSAFLLILTLLFSLSTTILLLEVVEDMTRGKSITFGETCRQILGKKAEQLANVFIALNQIFICIAYVIFFITYFQQVFELINIDWGKYVYLLISFAIMVPTIFINSLHIFRSVSFFGLTMGLIMIFSSLQYEIREIVAHNDYKVEAFNFIPTFSFIAVATTSIEGVLTILPCRSSMRKKKDMKNVMILAELIYVGALLIVMEFGMFTFGKDVNQIFLFNLPQKSIFYNIIILIYALNILATYPVQIFPAYIILDFYIQPTQQVIMSRSYIARFCLTIFIFIIAFLIPDISALLGILGSLFGATIQFTYPILLHWKYFKNQSKLKILQYYVYLGLSILITIVGFGQSLMSMIFSITKSKAS